MTAIKNQFTHGRVMRRVSINLIWDKIGVLIRTFFSAWVVDSGDDWTPSESELEPSEFEMASETSEESNHCTQSSSSDVSVR